MTTPVVFFHFGYPDYLELCINEARKNNDVILIGDRANSTLSSLEKVEHYDADFDNCKFTKYFLDAYRHMATGGEKFELLCFMRWAAICRVSKKIGLETVFHSDSDNIVYSNMSDIYDKIKNPRMALSVPQNQTEFRRSASPNVAYWNVEELESFCHYMLDSYLDPVKYNSLKEKWDWHQKNKKPGGVCDMTVLWHYAQENNHTVLTKLWDDNTTFDHNVNVSSNYDSLVNEYELRNGIKNITFMDGKPYCKNTITGREVQFHTLHFQGNAKSLIQDYVNRGPA